MNEIELERGPDGLALPTRANLMRVLMCPDLLGAALTYDPGTGHCWIAWGGQEQAELDHLDVVRARLRLKLDPRLRFASVKKMHLDVAMRAAARFRRSDQAKALLNGLRWDDTPRVERFASIYLGVPDSDLARAASRVLWTVAASRTLGVPAMAYQTALLVGDVDAARLAGAMSLNEPRQLAGGHLERWATRAPGCFICIRAPGRRYWWATATSFAHESAPFRATVLATTTDPHLARGNLRWLPLAVGAIDYDGIARDRLQLWAESRERFEEFGTEWQDADRIRRDEIKAEVGDAPR